MTTGTTVRFAGIPIKPDVDKLRSEIGVPKEGELIPYTNVERIIGCERQSNRFETVTKAWRQKVFDEHKIIVDCVTNQGFVALNPDEHAHKSVSKEKCGLRTLGKAYRWAAAADKTRMLPENIKVVDKMAVRSAAFRLAAATQPKELGVPRHG